MPATLERSPRSIALPTGVLAPGATVYFIASVAELFALDARANDGAVRLDTEQSYLRTDAGWVAL